jgi:hypothetical protein
MVPVSLPLQEIRRIEVPAVTGGQVALGLALGVLMAAAAVVVLGSVVKPFGN